MWGWAVYARSTTIYGLAASLDAGIAYVSDEVRPALQRLDGFVGLSMMVDRSSGRSIVTSAWDDQLAMAHSADQVRPLRMRAAEILGGQAEAGEWEIAVMHREHPTHQGACVRSTWLQMDPGRLDAALDSYRLMALPRIEMLDGFCSASLMMDRMSGRAVSSAAFESRAAMEGSRDLAAQIRSASAEQAGGTIVEIAEFDLAMAHLRVPELV
jgi:hypothetical protein